MPKKILPKPSRLRLVVLNDSALVLKTLCARPPRRLLGAVRNRPRVAHDFNYLGGVQ